MVKCQHAKEGDACFGKEFRNQTMLSTHTKFKHPDGDNNSDPSLEDIGLTEDKPKENTTMVCSDCGFELKAISDSCPNCGEKFESE